MARMRGASRSAHCPLATQQPCLCMRAAAGLSYAGCRAIGQAAAISHSASEGPAESSRRRSRLAQTSSMASAPFSAALSEAARPLGATEEESRGSWRCSGSGG